MTRLSIGINSLLGPSHEFQEAPFRLIDALPPNLEYMCLYVYPKGENEQIDNNMEGFMQHKESRFPQLVEIHGVDKTVVGVANFYADSDGMDEDDLWKWLEKKWNWIET